MVDKYSLERWTYPDSYFGWEWNGYYVFLGQHRDSDALTRSNFRCGLEAVQEVYGERGKTTNAIQVVRENHWAVGWVEWIAIHHSARAALVKASEIVDALEDYPVVSENDFCELEWEESAEYWESMSVRERARVIRDNCNGKVSMFAARRESIPDDPNGYLYEYLRGG